MDKILSKVENAYLYNLRWDGKVICINIVGYFYDAGCSQENDDRDWRFVGFCGYDMPLAEFLGHKVGDLERWEEQYTKWISDYTEQEVIDYLTGDDAPVMRLVEDIKEEDAHTNCQVEFIDLIY